MESIAEKVGLVKTESARIGEYLSGLTGDAWSTPSACDAWEVQDAVAHMVGAVDVFAGNIIRGLQGDSSPPEGFPPAGEGDMAARLRANAQRSIDLRKSLGAELMSTYKSKCDELDAVLAGLGEQDREKPCYHAAGIITVQTYLNLRLTELVVHEWDIRSRLEASAKLSDASLPAIMEMFPVFVVGRLFSPGPTLTLATRYRFELTGTAAGNYDIVAGDGKARMLPAGTETPDATLRCDTQAFVLLVYGRIGLGDALAQGLITAEGDPGALTKFD